MGPCHPVTIMIIANIDETFEENPICSKNFEEKLEYLKKVIEESDKYFGENEDDI